MNDRYSCPADIGRALPASARARKRAATTIFLGGLSRTSRRLILIGAALALAIVLGTALLGWILRRDAQANAEREISGLSILIAEQTARTVQSVDLQVRELRDRIARDGPNDAPAFRVRLATQDLHRELKMRTVNLPQLNGIIIVDSSGQLLNFNRAWPIPALDLSDRDYYQHFLAHPDDDGMYVSRPVRNRIDGHWTLYLARRVATADGRLAGLVMGAIELRYFSDLYASIGLAPGSLITLLRRDGVALAEYPERPGIIGNSLPATSNWYRLSQNDSAHYRFIAPFGGGAPLFVALKHIRGYDLVVNVATAEPYVFAEWRRLVMLLVLGSGPGLIVMFGLLRALVVQLRRIEAAGATARQRNQELEETRHTLDVTLENMEEGLIMVAADDRLAVCNRRAQEILQVSDAVLRLRPTLSELLTETWPDGDFDTAAPDPRFLMEQDGGSTVPRHHEQLLPDGSVVEVRTVPLAGGGIVRTFTDVTKRRRAEDLVRHSARHDDLTGLANRLQLRERLGAALQTARLHTGSVGVLYLDLDRFKAVNDSLGHKTGDRLLVEVAARLRKLVRETETVARMGGDEFVVVMNADHGHASATALAHRMVEAIGQPYQIGGHELHIGLSVGVALFPHDGSDADELLRKSDLALYRAKAGGRNTMRSFDPAADAPVPAHS